MSRLEWTRLVREESFKALLGFCCGPSVPSASVTQTADPKTESKSGCRPGQYRRVFHREVFHRETLWHTGDQAACNYQEEIEAIVMIDGPRRMREQISAIYTKVTTTQPPYTHASLTNAQYAHGLPARGIITLTHFPFFTLIASAIAHIPFCQLISAGPLLSTTQLMLFLLLALPILLEPPLASR